MKTALGIALLAWSATAGAEDFFCVDTAAKSSIHVYAESPEEALKLAVERAARQVTRNPLNPTSCAPRAGPEYALNWEGVRTWPEQNGWNGEARFVAAPALVRRARQQPAAALVASERLGIRHAYRTPSQANDQRDEPIEYQGLGAQTLVCRYGGQNFVFWRNMRDPFKRMSLPAMRPDMTDVLVEACPATTGEAAQLALGASQNATQAAANEAAREKSAAAQRALEEKQQRADKAREATAVREAAREAPSRGRRAPSAAELEDYWASVFARVYEVENPVTRLRGGFTVHQGSTTVGRARYKVDRLRCTPVDEGYECQQRVMVTTGPTDSDPSEQSQLVTERSGTYQWRYGRIMNAYAEAEVATQVDKIRTEAIRRSMAPPEPLNKRDPIAEGQKRAYCSHKKFGDIGWVSGCL